MSARVLVIGASRGIGRELVRQYLADGATVTATARQAQDVAALEAQGATAFALDVADATSASGLAWRVDNAGFDIAIVVAGVYGPDQTGIEAPAQADFDKVMHANVLGPMRVLAQLGDALAPNARLVVLSSAMGSIGARTDSRGWLYRASKAAVNSVVKDASLQFKGKATCIAIHPGWVQTDMGGPGAALTPERSVSDMRRTLAALTPAQNGCFLNHDGTPIAW
ncbi:MAG: SDR family oxidoreductase [Pseudomonadota bacterium]|nr:SDR family oxidoreductase [Pseudomonadota bacterium]